MIRDEQDVLARIMSVRNRCGSFAEKTVRSRPSGSRKTRAQAGDPAVGDGGDTRHAPPQRVCFRIQSAPVRDGVVRDSDRGATVGTSRQITPNAIT
jgi:hypothetical protein